ncbi:mCG144732, partial [Mus musculus]
SPLLMKRLKVMGHKLQLGRAPGSPASQTTVPCVAPGVMCTRPRRTWRECAQPCPGAGKQKLTCKQLEDVFSS